MALGHNRIHRRKRPLETSSSVPLSVGKVCLLSIAVATIGIHAPNVNAAKSVNPNQLHRLRNLRGGSSSPPGGGELNDQDLDEYIDFLLAYADNKATEEDNPLFKDELADAQTLLENLEESTAFEEESVAEVELHQDISSPETLKPMVQDVHNDTQIDEMVETLVASVDDKDVEEEDAVAIESIPHKDAEVPPIDVEVAAEASTTSIEEEVGEGETFHLGSSAVDSMPPPVAVEETPVEVTTSSEEEPPEKVPFFSGLMHKIGLKKKEESEVNVAPAVEPAEPVELVEEALAVQPVAPIEEEESVDPEEPIEQDAPAVESAEPIKQPSDSVEEPVGAISQPPEIESQTAEEITEEQETPRVDRMKQLMAPVTATLNVLDATKTSAARALDATKTSVVSSAKGYYQGTLGAVKGAWSKLPFQGDQETPERDYSKIYEKYFVEPTSDAKEVSGESEPNPFTSAFLKPWGTVKKYIPKDFLAGAEESYSIGITGYVTEEKIVATETDTSQADMDASTAAAIAAAEDVSSESVEEVPVVEQEIPEDAEVISESAGVEEVTEDAEVISESADVEEVTEDAEVIIETAEVEESVAEEITEDEVFGAIESEVAVEEAVAEDVTEDEVFEAIESEVAVEEVTGDAEVIVETTEAEAEEVTEESEILKESVEIDTKADDEGVSENIEIELELEEASEDGHVAMEGIDVEVEVDAEEVLEEKEFTSLDEEAHVEDVPEEIEADVGIEEISEEAEGIEEGIGVEGIDDVLVADEVPEDTMDSELEEVEEDQVEVVEDIPEEAEVLEEGTEAEIHFEEADDIDPVALSEEAVDDGLREEAEVDGDETVSVEETLVEDDPVEVPRKALFARLWGTPKKPKTIDPVEVDGEPSEITTEETLAEDDKSIDDEETTLDESPRKPSLFARLWGVSKEPKEIYSLGLQGINDSSSETVEVDVDVSVSIGIVEEDESLDDLEISESSGVEDVEDEIEHAVELDVLEAEQIDLMVENTESGRNIFQLHVPERQEVTEESNLTESEGEEVTDAITASEVSIEEEEITTLQLHQEDAILVEDDVSIESEREIDIEEDLEDSIMFEAESDVEEADIREEQDEEEGVDEFVVADFDEIDSDESEDFVEQLEESMEELIAAEAVEDAVSDESEHVVELLDEDVEEEETLVAATEEEGLISRSTEGFVEEEEAEDIIEKDVFVETTEEEIIFEDGEEFIEEEESEEIVEPVDPISKYEEDVVFENTEMDESEEEEIYVHDEDEGEPYSLEVEMQEANFVTRFLVNRGLEQLIMLAIVVSEWFRAYILAPFLESFDWIKKGKAQDLLQTVMKTRGGASALSESEGQTDEEEEVEEEDEVTGKDEHAESSDPDNSESSKKEDTEQDEPAVETAEDPLPVPPRVPPNFLFRRLLDYGFWGHLLIMEIILAVEWVNTYFPDIPRVSNFIAYDVLKLRKRSRRGPGEPDNLMNAGFVNTGEGSRLGRLPKKMRKKEDEKALSQLQHIGDVNEAKYSFVSTSFLERHEIGPYNVAVTEVQFDNKASKKKSSSSKKLGLEDDEEEESDSGWIMDALGVENKEEPADSGLPFDTSVGVSMGSGGPSVSVGVEFNIGGKKEKKKSPSLSSVLQSSSSTNRKPKRRTKPHVSDSESGLMGRIRAQGANSLVGRSILGAYPGDLPSPDEAADSRGVIDMAERYGYGDWSDEDDDETDDFAFGDKDEDDDEDPLFTDKDVFRPKIRSAKKRKAKRRRSSSSKNKQNIEIGASLNLGSSSQETPPVASVSSRKRRKRTSKSPAASSTSVASSLASSRPRRKSRSSSQLPSLAMEKLKTKSSVASKKSGESTERSSDAGAKDILSAAKNLKIEPKKKSLSPAMSLLDKAKKTTDTTSSKSETKEDEK